MTAPYARGDKVRAASSSPGLIKLSVLGRFELVISGDSVTVGASGQRLLTLLAVTDGETNREYVASQLWPDVAVDRAKANLRSVLWRLQRCHRGALRTASSGLMLAPEVVVDIDQVQRIAWRLLDRSTPVEPDELRGALNCNLFDDIHSSEPDQPWLASAKTRHRRLRLHALEALADELISIGWFGAAVQAAYGSVRADPYRESARQVLIKAYLAEGNLLDARREHATYCKLLRKELGMRPSEQFMRMLGVR